MEAKGKKKREDDQEGLGWQYKPAGSGATDIPVEEAEMPSEQEDSSPGGIEWTASEFIAHEKGFGWYAILVVAGAVAAALVYYLTKDMLSVAVVVTMAIIFGVAGGHKPRVIAYRADSSGLTVGKRFYPYSDYKSFSVPEDGPFTTIALVPMKRVAFPVGAYLAPESRDEVLGLLSAHLPLEHEEPGAVDRLMRNLRF